MLNIKKCTFKMSKHGGITVKLQNSLKPTFINTQIPTVHTITCHLNESATHDMYNVTLHCLFFSDCFFWVKNGILEVYKSLNF